MSSYEVELADDWAYGGGVLHGGWLVSTVTELALREVEHPHPLATSAHFVSAASVGPAVVDVEVLRAGRSVSSIRARLRQDEKVRVEVLVSAGTLHPSEPYWSRGDEPPLLRPAEECTRSRMREGAPRNGIVENVDVRYDGDVWRDRGTGRGEFAGWMRLVSGQEPDPLTLLTLCDALPPVTLDLGMDGWVPTIEYTVLVRALPAPGWLRAVQRARLLQDGWLDEECEIWDSTGRLVAQARQLAGFRA
ncbi:MAG: TesB-like acyl-CoA thioesterase 3 [Frankiales bacterium]|jgi:acyl-CoA thioesterase|nr:TesB-like acyl-CoA thioesterase 3 [Frankiales bacterium]